jgi:hypothetical protein
VRILYENQVEFNYLERTLLREVALEEGMAKIASQAYGVILVDRDYDPDTEAFLDAFRGIGGVVLDSRQFPSETDFLAAVQRESRTLLRIRSSEHLRMTHLRKYGVDVVFLSNEGEAPLTAVIDEAVAEIWDSEQGTRAPLDGGALTITLEPRKSVHLILA